MLSILKITEYIHPSERLCTSCDTGLWEDEVNFILIFPLYSNIRQMLLHTILIDNLNFSNISNLDQIIYLILSSIIKDFVNYIKTYIIQTYSDVCLIDTCLSQR